MGKDNEFRLSSPRLLLQPDCHHELLRFSMDCLMRPGKVRPRLGEMSVAEGPPTERKGLAEGTMLDQEKTFIS